MAASIRRTILPICTSPAWVAELSGMVRKHKGRFILSRDCRKLLAGNGLAAVYPILFRTYVEQFNWSYRDLYPELRFIQSAFLFTLYLLMRYGDTWRTLMRFAAFLGLAAVDPVSEERFCHQYRVKALPLLPEG